MKPTPSIKVLPVRVLWDMGRGLKLRKTYQAIDGLTGEKLGFPQLTAKLARNWVTIFGLLLCVLTLSGCASCPIGDDVSFNLPPCNANGSMPVSPVAYSNAQVNQAYSLSGLPHF